MPQRSLEHKESLPYKIIDFIIHTNLFIALCAASLTAWSQKLFLHHLSFPFISVTFSATLLLYNVQRMYLSFFNEKKYSFKDWYYKNKYPILILMAISVAGLYPLLQISLRNVIVYFTCFILGIFYFLPFSNLRTLPVIKSFTVGLVWVLVCIVGPLEEFSFDKHFAFFCVMQLLFISALCVLFNIRDMEEDRRSGTHSIPVLFGVKPAKIFTYITLLLYLSLFYFVENSFSFFMVCFLTFLASCVFTFKASLQNHTFYYGFGVDGLILFQSILGILLT